VLLFPQSLWGIKLLIMIQVAEMKIADRGDVRSEWAVQREIMVEALVYDVVIDSQFERLAFVTIGRRRLRSFGPMDR
jgi:hypothetical protein